MPLDPRRSGVFEDGTIACSACGVRHGEATALVAELREALAGCERELRAKRAQISRLQGDQVRRLSADVRYQEACDVLRAWAALCAPKTREITSDERVRLVIARLKGGYTVQQLIDSATGYAAFPYVVDGRRVEEGTPDRRFVKATLVYRSADHVDQGLRLVERIPKMSREEAYGWLDRETHRIVSSDPVAA